MRIELATNHSVPQSFQGLAQPQHYEGVGGQGDAALSSDRRSVSWARSGSDGSDARWECVEIGDETETTPTSSKESWPVTDHPARCSCTAVTAVLAVSYWCGPGSPGARPAC